MNALQHCQVQRWMQQLLDRGRVLGQLFSCGLKVIRSKGLGKGLEARVPFISSLTTTLSVPIRNRDISLHFVDLDNTPQLAMMLNRKEAASSIP